MMRGINFFIGCMFALVAGNASAQMKLGNNNAPIEISSDSLDVHQDQHKAIFTGNVIAVQGTSTMRSKVMTVFYTDSASPKPAPGTQSPPSEKPADNSGGQSITRIESTGDVVFTTPEETAQGDLGIYDVNNDTITLTGPNVTLTKDKNVLKGTKLVYNMGTGRSVLTSSAGAQINGKPARVHGLFQSGDKK